MPVAVLATAAGAGWLFLSRRARASVADLESAWHTLTGHSALILATALTTAILAAMFATRSAAGADASGYLSEAAMFEHRAWFVRDTLSLDLQDLDQWITTPLGWRPGARGSQVPTYPPGLPLLMAIPHAIAGATGASAIVIASAAIAVLATALLAAQLAGGIAGALAAMLLAFTPVFLHQSIQPMSDVPVTAAWMSCFGLVARRRGSADLLAGVACALAVLIRPNLAPLAIVPLMIAQRRVAFALPVGVAGLCLAGMQWMWYGSPLRSGYGSAEELFALSNIGANAPRYFNWLITTSPILLVAIAGFLRVRRERLAQALLVFAALVVASYLVYAVFDDWSYLRFLLPALAAFAVVAAVELAAWIERRPIAARAPLLVALMLVVMGHGLWIARTRETFRLAGQLQRVADVGEYINADVPPAAVILSGEQSGSMRYYTDRPILRWEVATPESLAAAMSTLEQARRPVYIVLDAWEDGLFRSKFRALPAGALDWPPMLDAGTSHRTRLWKLSDRDRFVRGENLNTIRLP